LELGLPVQFIDMKFLSVYIMGLLYLAAGVWHFVRPPGYVSIVPPWLPAPLTLVYISGACEILLGALLFPESTRTTAAWGIIVLLIAIFPANIQMAINYFHYNNSMKWLTVARLPLQLVLIWWAWVYT
jgi:uncharacterized membrane protein